MKADPALLHLGVDLGAAADKIVLCDPPGVPLYMACAASAALSCHAALVGFSALLDDIVITKLLRVVSQETPRKR